MDNDFRPLSPNQSPSPVPETEPPEQSGPVVTNEPHRHHKKSGKSKRFLVFLLVIVLLAGAGAAGWLYRGEEVKEKDAEIARLNTEVQNLRGQAANGDQDETEAGVSDEDRAAIADAIAEQSYEDLRDLFGDSVTIVLAASEGLGERTPDQAVADLAYLNDATAPWNFELPAATLEAYGEGDYANYFPEDALVGQSANDYVVSFSFTGDGNIGTIFITSDASVL